MAEYKLNYTASDINDKLAVIDGTKQYYTSEEVDEIINNLPEATTEVTENSDSLITSGGVYEALQNIDTGESYAAGDLIEIKDGVIRSTLGDIISTKTEEAVVELYHEDNIDMEDQGCGTYIMVADLTDIFVDANEKLTAEFVLSDGTNKTFNVDDITSESDGEVTIYIGSYNCVETDGEIVKVDESLDALWLTGIADSGMFVLYLVTFEDYTGASVTISQNKAVECKAYVTLPDNALIAGDLIKIENGVVSSTLTFDDVPTENSDSVITSGGVYDVIQDFKQHFKQHSEQLGQHSEQLGQHSEQLGQHSEQLGQHSEQLGQHSEQLGQLEQQIPIIIEDFVNDNEFVQIKTKNIITSIADFDNKIELVSKLVSNNISGYTLIGQNILSNYQIYSVVYDEAEYYVMRELKNGNYYIGDMDKYGFVIYQSPDNSTTLVTDNNEHVTSIYGIETSMTDLMSYLNNIKFDINALQNIGGSEVSWEDIVDRPFYEGVITMTMPTDISNSTVISSQSVSTVGGLQFTYVKVGDAYWNSKEDVVGAIMNVDYQLQGTNFDVTVEVNDVVSLGENGFGVLYANNGVFPLSMTIHSVGTVIFPTSGAYGEDLVFNVAETGTYLLNISGMCVVTSFENEQLKQIDSKFIPSGVDGGGVSEWNDIQNKPGDLITTTTETNNSYTTTLGAPTATSPFATWKDVSINPSEIHDDIQENTPITVSYMVDENIVEIGSVPLFTNATFDTMLGVNSGSTGYWGVINAAQTITEILTQGIWTRADSSKPTFVVLLAKNNTSGRSWLTIAAPENLAGNTFIVSISTTETETTSIKLSNDALNLDTEPTEGSTNYVNSGDLYNLIGDIDTAIAQLESLVGGASV